MEEGAGQPGPGRLGRGHWVAAAQGRLRGRAWRAPDDPLRTGRRVCAWLARTLHTRLAPDQGGGAGPGTRRAGPVQQPQASLESRLPRVGARAPQSRSGAACAARPIGRGPHPQRGAAWGSRPRQRGAGSQEAGDPLGGSRPTAVAVGARSHPAEAVHVSVKQKKRRSGTFLLLFR